ncbi:MAG: ammonium transporter [Deltaproteobacteria bacterium]|nr:ammonium transporter [Deltaproteobacteria bacterium]
MFQSLCRKSVVHLCLFLILIAGVISFAVKVQAQVPDTAPTAVAPVPPPAVVAAPPATNNFEERIADLEAYMNNGARVKDLPDSKVKDSKVPGAGPGHNAWMMVCAALVLFMTLPGLALFYGGLVRSKNVLSVLAQCFGIAGLVTLLWWAFGYSWVFSAGADGSIFKGILGGIKFAFLNGVDSMPNTDYSAWVSHNVFAMYQMMFAIITPALMIGAIAERMKFSAIMLFVALWMMIVYFPIAHMVWGVDGLMNGVWNGSAAIKAIDFAGGTVVHMSSGWSALILCLLLGKRLGYGKDLMAPHSMVLCMVGTGMLWVGWYGFNAGSAVAADGIAANAFMTTTLAAAVASFTWALLEYMLRGKPSVLGFCSGAVGGLVVITPACGFVTASSAVIIGVLAGAVPFVACTKLKHWFGYDDALDTFGVHAIGGTLGAFVTGIFADASVNGNLSLSTAAPLNPATQNGLAQLVIHHGVWIEQLKAMGITIVLSVAATFVIAAIVKVVLGGIRVSEDVERQGLDVSEHGEEGYVH